MLKRFIDILISLTALIVGLPIFIILWLMVRWKLGSPSLFTQIRPGMDGKSFRMYKFRTMTNACDADGKLLPNEKRMTRFGNFLRSSSLDELPELWNVLKGEMSLVGPRPLLVDYLEYYTPEQQRRHEVRPGITGWAQVNGRNAISWDQKLDLDVWYVDNQSFWLDLQILWRTVWKVIRRDGIRHEGSVSMPRFDEYMKAKQETT
jgi:sugar transferase EpsL